MTIYRVSVVVWVLDMTLGVVSRGVVAVVATIVGGDMAGNGGCSGCNRWGWGLVWGAVDLSGSWW